MKVFRYLLCLLLVFLSLPALAQVTSPKPNDLPAPVTVLIEYKSDGTANIRGDGSDARGGIMPVVAKQLADIPTPDAIAAQWLGAGAEYKVCADSLTTKECKFRAHMNASHLDYADPERAWCIFGGSHLHMFFGAVTTNACSTYTSLRTQANAAAARGEVASTFAGGPLNATAYWISPPMLSNPFGDGKNYAVIGDSTVYYSNNPGISTLNHQFLPNGLRYQAGPNPDDPDNCGLKNELNKGNGGPGTGCATPSGNVRYKLDAYLGYWGDGYGGNGFIGWKCLNSDNSYGKVDGTNTYSPSTARLDGTDPWDGTCKTGSKMIAEMNAPKCYDGVNLWVPGAINHFRPTVQDNGPNSTGCFNHAFTVPQRSTTYAFKNNGPSDYLRWRCAADDMFAQVSGHPWPNCSSFHDDWMDGWDVKTKLGSADGTIQGWQRFCNGVEGFTPHECDSGAIRENAHLIGGYVGEPAPDNSRNPQVDYSNSFTTSSASGMMLMPTNKGQGNKTFQVRPK